ncbi:MAG TPA: patatin-like phospholipase family protein [Bacillota bacterium]|nr:patatin-like phospholipase family protein [Bacillota bacterium]HUM55910.1 patatin-like phospholipase family protein [Bacillota bacterium]
MKKLKTALVLSGGGARGSYQIGVWKALKKIRIKPDIVVGTSVGAINGAMIVLGKFSDAADFWLSAETDEIFAVSSKNDISFKTPVKIRVTSQFFGMPMEDAFGYAKDILINGGADSSRLFDLLKKHIDETKLRRSLTDYGLVTVSLTDLKSHYLFTDDIPVGELHDFILASASCFPAAKYHEINITKYIDGGYADNMPVEMALEKGAERIIAVDLNAVGKISKTSLKKAEENAEEFILISSTADLGNFLVFDPKTAARNMKLGFLDAMKAFGRYEGKYLTFRKKSFGEVKVKEADTAGRIFGLDPSILYSRKSFEKSLKKKLFPAPDLPDDIKKISDIKKALAALLDHAGPAGLTVIIAEDIMRKGDESYFLKTPVSKLFKDQIIAANYIAGSGMLVPSGPVFEHFPGGSFV